MAPDSTPTRVRQHRWLHGAVASGALVLLIAAGNATTAALAAQVATAHRATTAHAASHVAAAAAQVPASVRTPADVASAAIAPAPVVASAPPRVPAAHRVPTPVRKPVAAAPPPAPSYRNHLTSADGTLNTGVGWYSDCSGRTELSHAIAAIETCIGGRTYFVGHNPGVFTPLLHMGVGSIITWYDGNGTAHRLRVIGVRTWHRFAGVPPLMAGATAEFQTCITADGTVDRLMDAAPA
jgi:hypothetical protein